MNSVLKLYSNTQLKEDKNFCMDASAVSPSSHANYLANKLSYTANSFQLFKPLLDLSIKVNLSQDNLYGFAAATYKNVDYVSFEPKEGDNAGKIFYYFVIAKRWTAESTIALELRMDTLNTFKLGTDYQMTPRTIVEREHKDRFTALTAPIKVQIYHSSKGFRIRGEDETYESGGPDLSNDYLEIETGIKCKDLPNFDPEHFDLAYFFKIDGLSSSQYDLDKEYRFNGPDYELQINIYISFYTLEPETEYTWQLFNLRLYSVIEMVRNIDFYPEGLTPVLYKTKSQRLTDKLDTAWNLCYLSGANENDPIVCQLIPDSAVTAIVPTTKLTISTSEIDNGYLYYIYQNPTEFTDLVDNPFSLSGGNESALTISIGGNVYTLSTSFYSDYLGYFQYIFFTYTYLVITIDSGQVGYEIWQDKIVYSNSQSGWHRVYYMEERTLIAKGAVNNFYFETATEVKYNKYYIATPAYTTGSWTIGSSTLTIKTISEYDRTNSKLYKIIKLPYAPTSYTFNEGEPPELTFEANWTADSVGHVFTLNDLNAKFKNHIESNGDNPIYSTITSQLHRTLGVRDDSNESKLFHSDFYQVKFVYDSFSFVFQLEKIDSLAYIETSNTLFQFNFVTTSTINSKFLFEFPNYILKLSTEDYDNVLPVARNNEVTIYNNEYLNYLRTAYHYDLKAKERTINAAKLGLGLGIGASALSGGMALAQANPVVAFTGLASAGSSIASGIVSTINTIAAAEESFASKQDQLKAQSFSVSGSDDVDLMEYYTGNRAKLVEYSVSERMKKALADLFYYCGYATNEQKVPTINTRYYFNFLKCQLSLKEVCYNEDVSNDLVARYSQGVTFIHVLYQGNIEDVFTRENYEISLQ